MLWPRDLIDRDEQLAAIEHETRVTPFAGDLASSEQENVASEAHRRRRRDELAARAALAPRTGLVAASPVRPPTESARTDGAVGRETHEENHREPDNRN